jgi:hypothetical protein
MNTLREIGEFVGMSPRTSMRAVGNIVPLLSSSERTSMHAMILGLQNLPPISLEAEAVGDRFGEVPFSPVFRVHPSNGVILETRIILFQNGPQPEESAKVGDSGDFRPFTLNFPDIIFFIQVRRTGITNTGITVLVKNFHVEATPRPTPEPPPPVPPFISVKSNGDGSFMVSGSGFVPKNATVNILVGDGTLNQNPLNVSVSAKDGDVKDFPTGKICQRPGKLFFEATDGRFDQGSQVFSNTVTISCPS